MTSSRASACAQFARTWTSGSRRPSIRAGIASSGMAVAFIQPAEATLRMSPQASLRPAAKASVDSGAGSWRSPASLVRARSLPRSGRRGAVQGPRRPRQGRACPGPARRRPEPSRCHLRATGGTSRRSPPGWRRPAWARTLVTSTLTWSFASSSSSNRVLTTASLVSRPTGPRTRRRRPAPADRGPAIPPGPPASRPASGRRSCPRHGWPGRGPRRPRPAPPFRATAGHRRPLALILPSASAELRRTSELACPGNGPGRGSRHRPNPPSGPGLRPPGR